MHADEVEIDVDLVRRLIAAQFPAWVDLPIEHFESGGTVNAVYRLGVDKYVRLPLIEAFAHGIEWEAKWLPKLAPQLPLAVPEVLGRGTPAEGYPFNWSVYQWIDGETWRLDRVDDPNEAAQRLAEFIASLRKIDGSDIAKPPALWAAPLPKRDGWVRATIDASRDMIDADALTAAWEEAVKLPIYGGPPIWVHSDMLRGNVIVKERRLAAVIDFGSVHGGDPARDLVAGWTLLTTPRGDALEVGRSRMLARSHTTEIRTATWSRVRFTRSPRSSPTSRRAIDPTPLRHIELK
jgi:aminoglycoside phosphotransferase (APT) family kinase protein